MTDTNQIADGVELEDGGPALTFMPFVVMDDLLDKLKLLNYECDFVRQLRMKPISRHYFAIRTNPGEQFYLFTTLAAWLIRKCDKHFETPQEFDDPNTVIANILDAARQSMIPVDFPPSKLKQGYGEHVIFLLDHLADEALKSNKFKWNSPQYPQEETEEDVIVDDDSELSLSKMEENMHEEEYDDDDDEHMLGIQELRNLSSKSRENELNYTEKQGQTTTDTTEWQLELEQVLPQLRLTIHNDAKDWRNHLDQMHNFYNDIEKCFATTNPQLDKLQHDISRSLEKIHGREKYLNTQLEPQLAKFRSAQEQLTVIKEQYREVSGGVHQGSRLLAEINDELEMVKHELEERSNAMTDGSPVVDIRKALARVKNEIIAMDVQIAVLEHSLLHAKLREKSNVQRGISASLVTSPFTAEQII